jgi:UDP-glucose 4-epimerase
VIATFVRQAIAGQPITVYGNGQQPRCFTHVDDVVAALIALMDHPGATGEVYNIGSSEEVTISALAEQGPGLKRGYTPKRRARCLESAV